jgi:TRAP-type C4-dicarboxylate transport system permease small subunit
MGAFMNLLQRGCVAVGASLLVLSAGLVFVGVLGRVGGFTVGFSGALIKLCVVFGTVILIGSVARRDEHARIAYVSELIFRRQARPIYHTLENVFSFGLLCYLIYAGKQLIDSHMATGFKFLFWSGAPGGGDILYPEWINIAIVEACFFIALLFYGERIWKQIRGVLLDRIGTQPSVTEVKEKQDESRTELG